MAPPTTITAASNRPRRLRPSAINADAIAQSIKWHQCFLDELTLFAEDEGIMHWKKSNKGPSYELQVGHVENKVGPVSLRIFEISSKSNTVLRAQCFLPKSKTQCDIFVFEPLYRFSLSFFDNGSLKPTRRWILQLAKPQGTSAWNRLKTSCMNLTQKELRYINVPRKLDPRGLIDHTARPRTVTLDLPGFSTRLIFVNGVASRAFQGAKDRVLGINLPSTSDSLDEPPRRNRDSELLQKNACAICGKGKVKASKHQLKQKRAQAFIGCQAGPECENGGYWNHFKCLELDPKAFVKTSKKWWCDICRISQIVDEDGYEPKA